MANEDKKIGWKLWIQWVLVYSLGIAIGTKLAFEARSISSDAVTESIIGLGVMLLFGLIVGTLQWLVLAPYGFSPWWIVATLVGNILFFYSTRTLLGAAILQCVILWRRVHWSGLWLLAHMLSYFLFIIVPRFDVVWATWYPPSQDWSIFVRSFVLQVLVGAITTATILVWLLKRPKIVDNLRHDTPLEKNDGRII